MNPIDDYRSTHDLYDVLSRAGILTVQFTDGDAFDLSGGWPIPYSVYERRGGWGCTVEQYLGSSEERKRLFRPLSGIDIYEADIATVAEKSDGTLLYRITEN